MKINIDIEKDLVKLQLQLGKLKSKQLPYAVAKALNELAVEARPIVQEQFRHELTVRNRGLLKKGIQINWAQKNDWPFAQSEVGIPESFEFLSQHVTGAVRRGMSVFGRAVPVDIKRSSSGKVPAGMKPSALLRKKNTFIIKSRGGKEIIARRETKKERYPIKLMYGFTKNAKIRDKVTFQAEVTNMFSSRFDLVLGKNLAKAIASIKA